MKQTLLGLAFLLELTAFISFACLGYLLTVSSWLQLLVSLGAFVILIIFWSLYMAPKAPYTFSTVPYYISKSATYGIATVVLLAKATVAAALLFVVLAIVDEVLLFRHNLEKPD